MKKTILAITLFSLFGSMQAQAEDADYALASKLIKENHELKLKTNNLEMKYRNALLESQKTQSSVKENAEKINALIQQNKSITQKYNNALVKSAQYDSIVSKIKSVSNQILQINNSLLELVSQEKAVLPYSSPKVSAKQIALNEKNNIEKAIPKKAIKKIQSIYEKKSIKLKKEIVAVFVNDIGNLRSEPSPKAKIVGQTKKGDFVLLTHKYRNWYKIKDKQEWLYKTLINMN